LAFLGKIREEEGGFALLHLPRRQRVKKNSKNLTIYKILTCAGWEPLLVDHPAQQTTWQLRQIHPEIINKLSLINL
jgi:hypothetical protein